MSLLTSIHYNINETPSLLDIRQRSILEEVRNKSLTSSPQSLEGLTDSEQEELCALARSINHPYVVLPALCLPRKYAIHLIWVNLNPLTEDAESLFGDPAKETAIVKTVRAWAQTNPSATVWLWHDEALSPRNTTDTLKEELVRKLGSSRCELKNLRAIISSDSPMLAQGLHPCLPIYWRVDFARLLILAHASRKFTYNVVTDIDNKPMAPDVLFDQHTWKILDQYGFVLSGISSAKYENGFGITKDKKESMEAIFKTLLDAVGALQHSKLTRGVSGNSIIYFYHKSIICKLFGSFDHYMRVQGWKIPDGLASEYENHDLTDGDPRNDSDHPDPRFEQACFYRSEEGRPVFNYFVSWFLREDRLISEETESAAHFTPRVKRLNGWTPAGTG